MREILKENLKKEIEHVLPGDIEKRSFEIIGEELKMRHIVLDKMQEPVTKRVIHTTADFEYATTMTYSENAIQIARNLIRSGADIVTDTNMAKAGINKKRLAEYGEIRILVPQALLCNSFLLIVIIRWLAISLDKHLKRAFKLQITNILLNHPSRYRNTTLFQSTIHLLRQIVEGVIMILVAKQFVQYLVSCHCILVCWHDILLVKRMNQCFDYSLEWINVAGSLLLRHHHLQQQGVVFHRAKRLQLQHYLL